MIQREGDIGFVRPESSIAVGILALLRLTFDTRLTKVGVRKRLGNLLG